MTIEGHTIWYLLLQGFAQGLYRCSVAFELKLNENETDILLAYQSSSLLKDTSLRSSFQNRINRFDIDLVVVPLYNMPACLNVSHAQIRHKNLGRYGLGHSDNVPKSRFFGTHSTNHPTHPVWVHSLKSICVSAWVSGFTDLSGTLHRCFRCCL